MAWLARQVKYKLHTSLLRVRYGSWLSLESDSLKCCATLTSSISSSAPPPVSLNSLQVEQGSAAA